MTAIIITSIICATILLVVLILRYFEYKEKIRGIDPPEDSWPYYNVNNGND